MFLFLPWYAPYEVSVEATQTFRFVPAPLGLPKALWARFGQSNCFRAS